MAPKGKKKGGKKGGGGDDEMDIGKLNGIYEAKVASLQQKIVLEQERYTNSNAQINSCQEHELEMEGTMKVQKDQTRDKIRDMTTMYREMERRLLTEIEQQEQQKADQEKEKQQLTGEIDAIQKDTADMIKRKDEEIAAQKDRLHEMTSDFARMLKNTLAKMQDRIDFGINQYQEEAEDAVKNMGM